MKKINKVLASVLITVLAIGLIGPITAFAATSPTLNTSNGYSVLGASTVTNTGSTTTNGAVGVSPGTAITGFPPGVAGGNNTVYLHSNDAGAIAAQTDNVSAFTSLNQTCDQTFGAVDLTATFPAGVGPGVYCSTSSFSLSGNLNLTGSGVWIFKAASTLITATDSSVTGGDPCNVWWRVGSSATLGTRTSFIGNIFALASITLNTGATLNGRAMAQTGAVTLDGNVISGPTCTIPTPTSATLHVIKTLINDNGGLLSNANFSFSVNGAASQAFEADGQNDLTVDAGTYTITEPAVAGYSTSYNNCSGLVLANGGSATCTITNNDNAPSLVLDKIVIKDNGGTALESAWTLTANGGVAGTLSGPGAAGSTDVQSGPTFKAGTYALSESGPTGYTPSAWSCVKNSGLAVSGASITLGLGDSATCTITNDDIIPVVIPNVLGTDILHF